MACQVHFACILRITSKDWSFWGRVGWSHVWDPLPTISLPTPMYFLRLVTGSSGEKVHVGGPGAQVTDAGGRLEGWQPSGRLAGPCGRLVGPDGRPGAAKKDSLASGADRLVGLTGRQADRPCW